ncbi:hypothetical protein NC652_028208 [Populus alba x Populus x berolinensis]|nr:hypothetical protein NC652_028208 [Populus alba x Populus x berolinensis]
MQPFLHIQYQNTIIGIRSTGYCKENLTVTLNFCLCLLKNSKIVTSLKPKQSSRNGVVLEKEGKG